MHAESFQYFVEKSRTQILLPLDAQLRAQQVTRTIALCIAGYDAGAENICSYIAIEALAPWPTFNLPDLIKKDVEFFDRLTNAGLVIADSIDPVLLLLTPEKLQEMVLDHTVNPKIEKMKFVGLHGFWDDNKEGNAHRFAVIPYHDLPATTDDALLVYTLVDGIVTPTNYEEMLNYLYYAKRKGSAEVLIDFIYSPI